MTDKPTEIEWKRLYAAAEAFRKLAPWEWIDDDRVFGVKDPEAGDVYYCGVLGALSEVFALVAYEGRAGLYGYLKLLSGEIEEGPQIVEHQRGLMASFDDRSYLEADDRAVIRSLGLKFRGKNGWPMFRSYLPGYLPWFVTGAQARVLALCLEQALDVLPRYRQNPVLLTDPRSGRHLVRVYGAHKGRPEWCDEILQAPPPPEKTFGDVPVNEVGIARIRRLGKKRGGAWEIGYCYAPMPIQERRDQRPFLPLLLGIVDHRSGMVLSFQLEQDGKQWRVFRDLILSCLEAQEIVPENILLDHDDAEALAAPIAAALGIALHRVRELPAFSEALAGLTQQLLGSGLKN